MARWLRPSSRARPPSAARPSSSAAGCAARSAALGQPGRRPLCATLLDRRRGRRPRRRRPERAAFASCDTVGDSKQLDTDGDRAPEGGRLRLPCTWSAEQRVAAQLEEVVVDADPVPAEQLAPDAGHLPLDVVAGQRTVALDAAASGAGSAERSSLPLAFRGNAGRSTKAAGTMYAGSVRPSAARRSLSLAVQPGWRPRRPPAADRRGGPRAARPPPRARPGRRVSAASISPSSMRKPRILTWWSARPRNSSVPSVRQRARSPVR